MPLLRFAQNGVCFLELQSPSNLKAKPLTVQMKFEPVFVTVAVAEDEDFLRDFTNNVHINVLKRNTRRKEDTLAKTTI